MTVGAQRARVGSPKGATIGQRSVSRRGPETSVSGPHPFLARGPRLRFPGLCRFWHSQGARELRFPGLCRFWRRHAARIVGAAAPRRDRGCRTCREAGATGPAPATKSVAEFVLRSGFHGRRSRRLPSTLAAAIDEERGRSRRDPGALRGARASRGIAAPSRESVRLAHIPCATPRRPG